MLRKIIFFLIGVVIITGCIQFSQTYSNMLSPVYSAAIYTFYPRFDQVEVTIGKHRKDSVVKLAINNSQAIKLGDKTAPANLQVTAHTLLGHVTQHVVFYSIALLMGLYHFKIKLLRFISAAIVGLIIIELGDIPMVLIGTVEGLLLEHFHPAALKYNLFVAWTEILLNGGRIGFSIAVAGFVIIYSKKHT